MEMLSNLEKNQKKYIKKIPDFIIIGSAKCGTTSLYHYLVRHPDIFMSATKEPNFFADIYMNTDNWALGPEWYAAHFLDAKERLTGEASTTYTDEKNSRIAAERIKAFQPKTKLIYIMRNPLERIQSYYLHFVYRKGISSNLSLDQIISDGPGKHFIQPTGRDFYERCIYSSLYSRQLSYYLNYFTLNQFHLMTLESLKRDPQGEMEKLRHFLDIDKPFLYETINEKHNETSKKKNVTFDPIAGIRHTSFYRSVSRKCPDGIKAIYRKFSHRKIDNKTVSAISLENQKRLMELIEPDLIKLKKIAGEQITQDWNLPSYDS